jgi:hypothetical protein
MGLAEMATRVTAKSRNNWDWANEDWIFWVRSPTAEAAAARGRKNPLAPTVRATRAKPSGHKNFLTLGISRLAVESLRKPVVNKIGRSS